MYKIDDIFYEDAEYSARAQFCNENGLVIVEIDPDENGVRRFQIQSVPEPTPQETAQMQIDALKRRLADTDYKAIKYAEGELSATEYAPTKQQRIEWRAKINELQALYGN